MKESLKERYEIIRKFESGGMSRVYLVKHRLLNDLRVLKIVDKKETPEAVLMAEPYFLTELRHDSIPRIFDVEEDTENIYIIKEYIEGKTLEEVIEENGPMEEKKATGIMLQLCRVLIYLHGIEAHPIIHRDIKPDNIVITPGNRAVLIDFGISRTFKRNRSSDTYLLGSRLYSAPEVFGRGQSDRRSDIYSLGLTFYKLLTGLDLGQPPYEVIPPKLLNSGLSMKCDAVVMKCTKRNPEDRYQNVNQIIKILESSEKAESPGRLAKTIRSALLILIPALFACFYKPIFVGKAVDAYNTLAENSTVSQEASYVSGTRNDIVPDSSTGNAFVFKDKALEGMIREMLKKGENEAISRDEIEAIENVSIFGNVLIDWEQYKTFASDETGMTMVMKDGTVYNGRGSIETLEDLKYFKNLVQLFIYKNNITAIPEVAGMNKLLYLTLTDNYVQDISPVSNLTNLIYLRLGRNRISDISPVEKLENLTELELDSNYITSLEPVKNLTGLKFLGAASNNIDDISAVEKLKKLETFYFHDNKIEDVSVLEQLPNLKVVNMCGNRISTDTGSNKALIRDLQERTEQLEY